MTAVEQSPVETRDVAYEVALKKPVVVCRDPYY